MAPAFGIGEEYGSSHGGGGMSWADFNGDGLDDLTACTDVGEPLHFYQNTGGALQKIDPLVDLTCNTKQVLWVDFDNDGDKDLFATCHLQSNRLFQNNGDGTFTDISSDAGIPNDPDPSFGASFGDYDRDGFLDLYVSNYTTGNVYDNYLLRNNGNGTFTETSTMVGTSTAPNLSFQGVFTDYNNDLNPDIYVIVDLDQSNILFKNSGNSTFDDVSASSGAGVVVNAMNAGTADFDKDGDIDIYITNTHENPGNVLLRNDGNGGFQNTAAFCGVDYYHTSWGANWIDYDNDSNLDLYVSSIGPGETNNALFQNRGDCVFNLLDVDYSGNSWGSFTNACSDYNNDGRMDLAVSQSYGHPYLVLENQTPDMGNWVKVYLEGLISNRDGIGAWIEVYAEDMKLVHFTQCGESYLNQNSSTYHFGLDEHTLIDSIKVKWPSGQIDNHYSVEVNQTVYLLETVSTGVGPLPVSLSEFNIKKTGFQTVQLVWSTESEINADYFQIERSKDGRTFENIGRLAAKNISNTSQSYSFEDVNTERILHYYYRLKMVDKDESFTYSNIVSAKFDFDKNAELISVYPNPVKGNNFTIQIKGFKNQEATLTIYNQMGQQVSSQIIDIQKGENDTLINAHQLESGVYFISLEIDGQQEYHKLIVY